MTTDPSARRTRAHRPLASASSHLSATFPATMAMSVQGGTCARGESVYPELKTSAPRRIVVSPTAGLDAQIPTANPACAPWIASAVPLHGIACVPEKPPTNVSPGAPNVISSPPTSALKHSFRQAPTSSDKLRQARQKRADTPMPIGTFRDRMT